MSETTKTGIGKEVMSFDLSPQFEAYSGVEIIVDNDTTCFAGNRTGRVLTFENPWGTQAQATAILNALQAKGFQYQPYTASGAILNPAAEIGDGITISDTYSGIYKIDRNYSPLMASDLEAPQDEEVDHEYPYEPKQDRIYKRELADARAEIGITQDQITAEVTRATNAETSLRSTITQTADNINATVLKKSGGSSSSFGWTLTDSSWTLQSGGKTVFKATSSGVEVNGKITATSGTIGGFTIGSNKLYNGMTSLGDTSHNGVYIGTDGIALGKGNFKVTASGSISANNMTLTGTLNVGGSNISAATLRAGAQEGYNWGSGGGGYGGYSSRAAYALSGASAGYSANDKIDRLIAGNITATTLSANAINGSVVRVGGQRITQTTWSLPSTLTVNRQWSSTLGMYVVNSVSLNKVNYYPLVFGGVY